MTPEELEAAREYRAMLPPNGTRALNILLGNLLAHIDAQAAQISDLKRQIITLSDSVVSVESRKDRQIEAMKEKLVEERAQKIITEMGRFGFVLDAETDPYGKARQQLKTEMPGVEW